MTEAERLLADCASERLAMLQDLTSGRDVKCRILVMAQRVARRPAAPLVNPAATEPVA